MKYMNQTLEFQIEEPTVVSFGKFDGLHRGHELLMQQLFEIGGKEKIRTVVFTFDIPPKSKVEEEDSKVLTTNQEKEYIFNKRGIDYLIECPFTEQVMSMEPKEFIEWIVKALHMKYVVVGEDFRFGHYRKGNYQTLKEYEKEFGYQTIVVSKIQEDGIDISSTFIREEIIKGNIAKANHLLGYEYFVRSKVVHGNQIGRTIGIPTVNMSIPKNKLLPPTGVYVSKVKVKDDIYMGVTNVGYKPTVSSKHEIGVETYMIDFDEEIYDEMVLVSFLAFIRVETKFDSLEQLQSQMMQDIRYTKEYYRNIT